MFTNLALLAARLLLGVIFFAHGSQKLFGWFGGYGLKGTGGFFENVVGMRPGVVFAFVSGAGELVAGLLTLFGWLNPIGPALIVTVMIVAIVTVHISKGFWNSNGGYEFNLANIAGAFALAATGFGAYALDAIAPLPILANPYVDAAIFAITIAGGLLTLPLRRTAKPAETATAH